MSKSAQVIPRAPPPLPFWKKSHWMHLDSTWLVVLSFSKRQPKTLGSAWHRLYIPILKKKGLPLKKKKKSPGPSKGIREAPGLPCGRRVGRGSKVVLQRKEDLSVGRGGVGKTFLMAAGVVITFGVSVFITSVILRLCNPNWGFRLVEVLSVLCPTWNDWSALHRRPARVWINKSRQQEVCKSLRSFSSGNRRIFDLAYILFLHQK